MNVTGYILERTPLTGKSQVSIYHLSSHAEVEYVDKLTFYMMVVSAVAIRWGLRLVPVLVLCSHVNGKLILANKRHTTNN